MKFLFTLSLILTVSVLFAQEEDLSLPPYKRFPTLPPMNLLLGDSTTKYTKDHLETGKPTVIMMFSPDCEHCQQETTELVKHRNEFKNVQLVMITTYPIWRMNKYVDEYQVKSIPNVVVGKDMYYLLPAFFDMKHFPFIAVYNAKGQLAYAAEGSLPIAKLLQLIQDNR